MEARRPYINLAIERTVKREKGEKKLGEVYEPSVNTSCAEEVKFILLIKVN